MDSQTVRPAIISYLTKLKKQIKIDRALLFWSIASDKATSDSDVDLLVISADFAKFDQDERSRLLYRASVGFPYDLHVFGVTQNELDSASSLTTLGNITNQPTIPVQ